MKSDGIKIKNISAGMLYDVNLGIRDYFNHTNAMLNSSLFSNFLKENDLNVYKGNTRDLICLDFDFGSRSYEDELKRLKKLKEKSSKDKIDSVDKVIAKVESNKDKYNPKTREEIREYFYEKGVNVSYFPKKNLNDPIKIHYKMLFRTSAKAKTGQAIFINSELYDKAYDWLTMGIGNKLPKENAKIVELSAYAPLTTSTIIGTIDIKPENILILSDQDSIFKTMAKVVRAESYEKITKNEIIPSKRCIVSSEETEVKNTLWDGMGLIEDSIFPDYANGMMLLRNHFFKMCGFRSHISNFFRDWCKDNEKDYETYKVQDMFGKWHKVRDIKVITTDNAIKWKKFIDCMGGTLESAFDYWCTRIIADKCKWGIVKTDHISKFKDMQQMSYQMINTLPCTEIDIGSLVKDSVDYVELLKTNPNKFEDFLRLNASAANHYEMMADLYKHNATFANSTWFRAEKKKIIAQYVRKLKSGKIIVNGDNLTVCGNPYALLLYAAGNSWENDPAFSNEEGVVQCYTTRFCDGEYLAAIRNPHNSPNNLCYLHNIYSPEMNKYFSFSPNILALNCIGTDIQSRANGMDFDSDFMFATNHPVMVACAKKSIADYPTIVNELQESGITYENTMLSYAQMDNKFAKSRLGIGWSSNLAQLAMTYYWTELSKETKDKQRRQELMDNMIILSVLAQVIIDGCKREYEIDGMGEILRIQAMDCMQLYQNHIADDGIVRRIKHDYPAFMEYTRNIPITKMGKERSYEEIKNDKTRLKSRINDSLVCPMNWMEEYLCNIKNSSTSKTIPTKYFFIKYKGRKHTRQMTKIREYVEEYINFINMHRDLSQTNAEGYVFLVTEKSKEITEKLKKIKISNIATINRLIEIAIGVSETVGISDRKLQELNKHPRNILNFLYKMNKDKFLCNFVERKRLRVTKKISNPSISCFFCTKKASPR